MIALKRLVMVRMPGVYFHIRNVGRKVVRTRKHQRDLFSSVVRPGDLVFDVGANIGEFTGAFLDLGATVVAVEPQPHLADHLSRRYGGRGAMTVIRKALSDHEGEATLHLTVADALATLEKGRTHSNVGPAAGLPWVGSLTVPVTTADELVRLFGVPSLVKVDVEGHELAVLQGLTTTTPSIFFEVNRDAVGDVLAHLDRRGYRDYVVRVGEGSAWLHSRPWSVQELSRYLASSVDPADVLALAPDRRAAADGTGDDTEEQLGGHLLAQPLMATRWNAGRGTRRRTLLQGRPGRRTSRTDCPS